MSQIKIVKLIDANGNVFGVNQEGSDIIIRSKAQGYTGETFQFLRIDKSNFAMKVVSHAEDEAHEGHSFKVDIHEVDFDKIDEIGILFTTPNTASRFHCVPLVYASSAAVFHILEAPVIDVGNYPATFYTPINRERNSSIVSAALSIRATPVANQVSLKIKAVANSPITGDGTVIHAEVIGAGKKGGGGGMRDTDEYILKQNTNYYFRLAGTANGADASVASLHVNWFEHTDLE